MDDYPTTCKVTLDENTVAVAGCMHMEDRFPERDGWHSRTV